MTSQIHVGDDACLLDSQLVTTAVGVDPASGLSSDEVALRLAHHGPNELRASKAKPLWRLILAQFQDPLVYLLLGAVVVALAAWAIEGQEVWPVDAVVIGAVIVLNAALGFAQESKAANALAALARMAVKPGARIAQLDPRMAPVIGTVAQEAQRLGIQPRTITSGNDSTHKHNSRHYDGQGLDFRGRDISVAQGEMLAAAVRARLGDGYFVDFEDSVKDPGNNHLHIQTTGRR